MPKQTKREPRCRELKPSLPVAHSASVRNRIAAQIEWLNAEDERDVLLWIEAVSEFDSDESA